MLKLMSTCDANIQRDFQELNGFIALVHDESHLNRYGSIIIDWSGFNSINNQYKLKLLLKKPSNFGA